jgi:AraC-like DNA-binding protein
MPYDRFTPSPQLAPYVSQLWVQESLDDAATHSFAPTRVLPTGSVDIAVYYLEPFVELVGGTRRLLPRTVVTGPQSTFKTYSATRRTGIVMARIRPGAAAALFGLPLREFRDRNVDLADLVAPNHVRLVEQRVGEATTGAERAEALDAFLVSLLRPRGSAPVRVAAELGWIVASSGAQPIRALARAAGRTPRALQRRFRDDVGLSPKTFSRLVRLQAALQRRATGASWSMVAHTTGYQDQSHLVNECKELSGLTPSQVLRRRRATPLGAFYNTTSHQSPFPETMYL